MDANHYAVMAMAEGRLAEARALAARHALLSSLRPEPRGWRPRLGAALVAAGRRLQGAGARGDAGALRAATAR
jgi:hypothetical protein